MEGDLLGLDFGQTTAPTQAPQGVQSNVPSALPFQFDPWQPQVAPSATQLSSPVAQKGTPVAQLPPPTAQLAPPVVQLAPPVAQSVPHATQLASPASPTQQLAAQYQPPAVQQQSSSSSPTAQSYQVSGTSASNQWPGTPTGVNSSGVRGHHSAAMTQNVVVAGSVWSPSPSLDEPQDPVLKEIKEKFGGCWKLARSDPYDEYLKAAGVGIFARKLAITGTPEQHIFVKGNRIHIQIRSTLHTQLYEFKLEESVENLVEKSRQSVFCSYKDGKLILLMTPLEPGMNRTQEVQRYINDYGELVMMYTCGTATCRRYFARLADLVTPLNIVG